MKCPHFVGVFMKFCVAEEGVYVPSAYEMREYCRHQQHRLCQIYSRTENMTRSDEQCSAVRESAVRRRKRL